MRFRARFAIIMTMIVVWMDLRLPRRETIDEKPSDRKGGVLAGSPSHGLRRQRHRGLLQLTRSISSNISSFEVPNPYSADDVVAKFTNRIHMIAGVPRRDPPPWHWRNDRTALELISSKPMSSALQRRPATPRETCHSRSRQLIDSVTHPRRGHVKGSGSKSRCCAQLPRSWGAL